MPRISGPLTLLARSRKARWGAVVAMLPTLFVLSLGPVMWLKRLPMTQLLTYPVMYYLRPYMAVAEHLPVPVRRGIEWYMGW